jgi:hypothetical protein
MAGPTKEEWSERLRSWVPSWFFERDKNSKAYFNALAAVLADCEERIAEHLAETFILTAQGDVVDLHGHERKVFRLPGEGDAAFANRIRYIVNNSHIVAIKALVDAILINGESIITEDYNAQIFCDRENFITPNSILLSQIIKDAFSVLIPFQVHAPYSFCDREHFCGREDFYGRYTSSDEVFASVVAAVEAARAAGCLFRVFEKIRE